MSIEAMKLALEELEGCYVTFYEDEDIAEAITALRQAIEQAQKQEPAWYHAECDDPDHSGFFKEAIDAVMQVNEHGGFVTQLYTSPPQRQSVDNESDNG